MILTNTITSVDDLGFAALLDDAPLRPMRVPVPIDPAKLDDYMGTFRLDERVLITVSRRNDQLFAQATGYDAVRILPGGNDEFFARVGAITMNFNRDTQGNVTQLVLHLNGDHSASKVTGGEANLQTLGPTPGH